MRARRLGTSTRDLVGGAADATRTDLERGRERADRGLERLHRVLLRSRKKLERIIDDCLPSSMTLLITCWTSFERSVPPRAGEHGSAAPRGIRLGAAKYAHNHKTITGADVVNRYDLYDAIEIAGNQAPGYSSGQAITAMQSLASKLPAGYGYSGSAFPRRSQARGNRSPCWGWPCFRFPAAAALYESWSVPLAVILSRWESRERCLPNSCAA